MSISMRRRFGVAAILTAAVASVALPTPALAADPYDIPLPAGLACDFPLNVNVAPSDTEVKTFRDADGNVVRTLRAGKGDTLTFTNLASGAVLPLKGNGSVTRTTPNPDGTFTVVSTGHNVIILFPTDDPAGPSTTLHVGRVSYNLTSDSVFTLLESSGTTRDICDELG